MVDEAKLTEVLSDFARTLLTDFPIQGILDHLVERIVDILPVTGAGVTLISPGRSPRYVAASDDAALQFERLQTRIKEGPCLAAYDTGEAVSVPDLSVDKRFPIFSPAAVHAGLSAVFTFPLDHGTERLGALDLYCDVPGPLGVHDLQTAQTLADVTAAYLLNAEAREEARYASDRFKHSSLHDPLTGLPNRVLFEERLEHAARRASRSHTHAAILFADLDRFKQVNDNYGHQIGDELLLAVAKRLSSLVRAGDTLARVSGDEFVFLCEDLSSAADVEILATRIDGVFTAPFVLSTAEITATASVGMAYAGPGEEVSDQLLVKADMAMYQVKRHGGAGHQILDVRAVLQDYNYNSLESDLRDALINGDLDVAYQPIVRSRDEITIGVEALLRWSHRDRGQIPAISMIGVAEQSDLIHDLGDWILRKSCRDWAEWTRAGATPLDLAVNVSARQLVRPGFCESVADAIEATAMDPRSLVLEMTETIFIEDSRRAEIVLANLSALGLRLALDDFGTGYSSLSYLRRLPIDIVKIDQSFISDIGHVPTGAPMVAAVTSLAHTLGLVVVAEGVESKVQSDEVRSIGCEYAQGYYYAEPMPSADIQNHLGRQCVSAGERRCS